MGAGAKTSECKHRGPYIISPTTTAGLPTSLLLFISRTIAGQEALGDRVRSFTTTLPPALAPRSSISPFRPKSPSHVWCLTLAAASCPRSLFTAAQHQHCIVRHVFAFTSVKDASRQRDQLWSGHRG